jgi:hypothetical protein
VREAGLVQLPRKRRAIALAYLMPYLMLRRTGYRSAYHEETLRLLRRWRELRSVELVPYRVLDREHALWASGWTRAEPDWYRLARATALSRCVDPLGFDDDAAYSVTHTIFYLTDFGNRPSPLSASALEAAVDTLEHLLLHYWRKGHWDLVGELLASLNCLAACGSPIYGGAASAYHSAWRVDGMVPPKRQPAEAEKDERREHKRQRLFRLSYHPTLVAVIYCATAMKELLRREAGECRRPA